MGKKDYSFITKSTNLTKKTNLIQYEKYNSFTFTYNEIIKSGAGEHIRHELVPLLEFNYFKN